MYVVYLAAFWNDEPLGKAALGLGALPRFRASATRTSDSIASD